MGGGSGGSVAMLLLVAAPAGAGTPLPPPRPAPAPLVHAPVVPLPPPRPADLRSAEPSRPGGSARPVALPEAPGASPPPPSPAADSLSLAEAQACLRLFREGRVTARLLPAIAPAGPGCGIASPAEISSIAVGPGGGVVRVTPPITVGCAMGNALAAWVREDLASAFAATGSPLVALTGTSGYACRARDGLAGAKPSEHGLGHAVDIGGFLRADRTAVAVRQPDAAILDTVRTTACARFATVLGPGSDAFHAEHLHVDIEERRNRATLCQWDRP